MPISTGKILISTTALDDPNFDKAVIYITAYNEKGAMGFVINKQFHRVFNELQEFKQSKAFPLYEGGPVEKESLYFLHRKPNLIEGSSLIADGIYLGGNFKQAVQCINENRITERDIKMFIGYCGWDFGELEAELAEGSWLLCEADIAIVFVTGTAMLWEDLYKGIT